MSATQGTTPQDDRGADKMQGHWLLASVGKRVLRPGGAALSRWLIDAVSVRGSKVVELAPGLGHTAAAILQRSPATYTAVDADPVALARVTSVVGDKGTLIEGDAATTGLADGVADVVVGEAMLTMQNERGKHAIAAEAHRILRPGGRYAIHELALTPDSVADEVKENVRTSLARSIKVNARPLTAAEWKRLLEDEGFVVRETHTAPMALLQVRRILQDEGVLGFVRIMVNLARRPDARRRVLQMRSVFRTHQRDLTAIAIVAERPLVAA